MLVTATERRVRRELLVSETFAADLAGPVRVIGKPGKGTVDVVELSRNRGDITGVRIHECSVASGLCQ